jgi:hypothetical protein
MLIQEGRGLCELNTMMTQSCEVYCQTPAGCDDLSLSLQPWN